jgi:hypothetical protein
MSNYNINNVNGYINKNTDKYSSPVNFNIGNGVLGSYDNILLQTNCSNSGNPAWRSPPCMPPVKSSLMFLPQGTPLPLKNEEIYSELPKDSMFLFAQTVSNPSCRSQYSSDRGPLCLNSETVKYIGEMRGKNKTYENYNF